MGPLKIWILVISSWTVVSGQFLNCDWVATLDCTKYTEALSCGTDGITYPNRCYFARQQCKDSGLHILHDGACLPSEQTTTPRPPSPTVNGQDAVLDFFCTQLSHRSCDDSSNPVCASDGWTYKNYCEYDKARCTHRDLHVVSFGQCTTKAT